MMITRLRASPRHDGSGGYQNLSVTDPQRGCPIGGGGVHHKGNTGETLGHSPCILFRDLSGFLILGVTGKNHKNYYE